MQIPYAAEPLNNLPTWLQINPVTPIIFQDSVTFVE